MQARDPLSFPHSANSPEGVDAIPRIACCSPEPKGVDALPGTACCQADPPEPLPAEHARAPAVANQLLMWVALRRRGAEHPPPHETSRNTLERPPSILLGATTAVAPRAQAARSMTPPCCAQHDARIACLLRWQEPNRTSGTPDADAALRNWPAELRTTHAASHPRQHRGAGGSAANVAHRPELDVCFPLSHATHEERRGRR